MKRRFLLIQNYVITFRQKEKLISVRSTITAEDYTNTSMETNYFGEVFMSISTANEKSDTLLTTGSIWKKMTVFAFPLFLGALFQQLYNTADSLIVGK